jgi:hypothetical protein
MLVNPIQNDANRKKFYANLIDKLLRKSTALGWLD